AADDGRCSVIHARTPRHVSAVVRVPSMSLTTIGVVTAGTLLAEALFLPRVGIVVVAVALPEAEPVVRRELEAADPLGALPEVALGHDEPERPSVLELQRLALEGVREQHVVVIEDVERDVRGVPLL